MDGSPPLSPPLLPSPQEPKRKRSRHDTYNVSPPSPGHSETTPTAEKDRKRRDTFSVSSPAMQSVTPPRVSLASTASSENKQRDTYSISPPLIRSRLASDSPSHPTVDQTSEREEPIESSEPESRKRQRESSPESNAKRLRVEPAPNDLISASTQGSVGSSFNLTVSSPLENSPNDQDVHSQILGILKQRVEERKKDPNYKPVFGGAGLDSKIPVKATSTKFNQAHSRQFNKMVSIVDYQKKKEQRATQLTSSATKRPKMTPGRGGAAPTRPPPPTSGARPFRPTVTSVKNVSFHFNSTAKTPGKMNGGTAVKTSKPATPAIVKTAARENKPLGNTSARKSTGKPSNYKPHTGKIPKFQFSLY